MRINLRRSIPNFGWDMVWKCDPRAPVTRYTKWHTLGRFPDGGFSQYRLSLGSNHPGEVPKRCQSKFSVGPYWNPPVWSQSVRTETYQFLLQISDLPRGMSELQVLCDIFKNIKYIDLGLKRDILQNINYMTFNFYSNLWFLKKVP